MNDDPDDVLRKAEALLAKHRGPQDEKQPAPPVDFPTLTEIAVIESGTHDQDSTLGWCDDQFEFEFGLDLILDGIERLHRSAGESPLG